MAQGSIGKIINGEYVPFATNGGGSVASHDATKVDKTDISSIILAGSINNTGGTISAGTWFYLNGTPCVAKVDIASGATFTKDTNYEEKTVGSALSELNSKSNSYMIHSSKPGGATMWSDMATDVRAQIIAKVGTKPALLTGILEQTGYSFWPYSGAYAGYQLHMLVYQFNSIVYVSQDGAGNTTIKTITMS